MKLAGRCDRCLMETHRLYLALHLVCTQMHMEKSGSFKSAYDVMNNWGANHGAISYGHVGADLITLVLHAAYSGKHAQCTGGEDIPSGILECIRNG